MYPMRKRHEEKQSGRYRGEGGKEGKDFHYCCFIIKEHHDTSEIARFFYFLYNNTQIEGKTISKQ